MSLPELTIDFDAAGTGHCLYGETIDLQSIGLLHMQRASRVEFNADTQQWEVLPPDGGDPMFTHASRVRCLAWERSHLHPTD